MRKLSLAISGLVLFTGAIGAGVLPAEPATGQPPVIEMEEIGSLRNARIAHAMPTDPADRAKVQLTFLTGELTSTQQAMMKQLAPNVKFISVTRQSAITHAAEADGVDARLLSPEFLEKATRLTWVHAGSAGVDSLMSNKALVGNEKIVLTNARGVHGPAIADHAIGMLLQLTRQLGYYASEQERGTWSRGDTPERPIALAGKTMLVVGIGGIGTEVAKRAHGFGMRVIATRRSDTPAPDYVEHVGKPDTLKEMLPEADVVAICTPLTPETQGLFNADMIAAMKKGSYLINIGRGKIVDSDALAAALNDGRLGGACLDVTDPEPLPSGHALWKARNIVITPHVSADSDLTDARRVRLFNENVRRFGAGEPLLNCVDVKAGY